MLHLQNRENHASLQGYCDDEIRNEIYNVLSIRQYRNGKCPLTKLVLLHGLYIGSENNSEKALDMVSHRSTAGKNL